VKTWADYQIELPSGASGEVDTTCPECSGTRKKKSARCLSVNVEKGVFDCKHCGWSGGLGTGAKPGEVFDEPARPKVYKAPRPIPSVVAPTLWERARFWFQTERGIPESVLLRNRITVAREWCRDCEEEQSHILFPFERDGIHVNTKHRCAMKHFRMEPGAERIFYGLPDVVGASTVVIVEGEIDKLSCEVAGWLNVLSVPDGAPALDAKHYASKFAFLESAQALFESVRDVVIAVDMDGPGGLLRDELVRRFGPEKCRVALWPDGCKDANDCLRQHGAEAVARVLRDAAPVQIDGIFHVRDLTGRLDHLYEHGFDPGVGCGWLTFDRHYRPRPGLLTIVTGIPSHGKSTFLDDMLVRLAERHGWRFAICSPENQPLERHMAALLAKYTGRPFHDGPTARMGQAERELAQLWLDEHFGFVLPESPTVEAILERVKALVFRMGVKGVVVDPWNEIEHSRPDGQGETDYISACLSKFRRFAHLHDVHLWLVAHPTKLKLDEHGKEPLPTLWDISGSAHFRNKADYGLIVWRDIKEPGSDTVASVEKIRFQETGEPGKIRFQYDRVTGRFKEVG
jgi:twinkle protein